MRKEKLTAFGMAKEIQDIAQKHGADVEKMAEFDIKHSCQAVEILKNNDHKAWKKFIKNAEKWFNKEDQVEDTPLSEGQVAIIEETIVKLEEQIFVLKQLL